MRKRKNTNNHACYQLLLTNKTIALSPLQAHQTLLMARCCDHSRRHGVLTTTNPTIQQFTSIDRPNATQLLHLPILYPTPLLAVPSSVMPRALFLPRGIGSDDDCCRCSSTRGVTRRTSSPLSTPTNNDTPTSTAVATQSQTHRRLRRRSPTNTNKATPSMLVLPLMAAMMVG